MDRKSMIKSALASGTVVAIYVHTLQLGSKFLALAAAGYKTWTEAITRILVGIIGIYVPWTTISVIASIISDGWAALQGDIYELGYMFIEVTLSLIPGLSWWKLIGYLPVIVSEL